jgi:WD40 repeat protein
MEMRQAMYRYLFLTPCLLALLLAGCPSMPTAPEFAETKSTPELEIIYSTKVFDEGIGFLAFSKDGNTFIAGDRYDGVGLFRADDFTLLERHYERGKSGASKAYIISAGYFDTSTWYFTAVTGPAITYVRTIQPSQEIARYTFEYANLDMVAANKNYFACSTKRHNGVLVNWRTGEKYPIKTVSGLRAGFAAFELTHSNRVLSVAAWQGVQKSMLDDPLHQKTQTLDGYITFSPDERYGVDWNGYRCKFLEFHEKEVEPLEKQKVVGYCSGLTGKDKEKKVMFSPNGTIFAVAIDHDVRVYRVEPFQLIFERKTPGSVVAVVLSDTGWLVAADGWGFLRAWDVATGRLVGQRSLFDSGGQDNPNFAMLMAIQPEGNKLLTDHNGLTVFKLPER